MRFLVLALTCLPLIGAEIVQRKLSSPGTPKEWGETKSGRTEGLAWLGSDCILLTANSRWSMGMKSDGTLIAWGSNTSGQTNYPSGSYIDAVAGWFHGSAIRNDGEIIEWGTAAENWTDQTAYANTHIDDAVRIAAGDLHTIVLREDNTVFTWGGRAGVTNLQTADLTNNIVDISAGWYHNMVLKSDGTVRTWGEAKAGQDNTVPEGLSGVTAIVTGPFHNVALKSDGTVVAWGYNPYGQCDTESWTDIVQIGAGRLHTFGVKSDGSMVWVGIDASVDYDADADSETENAHKFGQTTIPSDVSSAEIAFAGSSGHYHGQAIVDVEESPGGGGSGVGGVFILGSTIQGVIFQ